MSSTVFRCDPQPAQHAPADEIDDGYMMWVLALFVGLYLLATIPTWRLAIAWRNRKRLANIAIMPGDGRGMATISQPDATQAG
jgi:hypothetical protein